MANNVMWLVNKRTGVRCPLAKFYPSTGWYPCDASENSLVSRLEAALKDDEPGLTNDGDNMRGDWPMYGRTDWVIEYDEVVG